MTKLIVVNRYFLPDESATSQLAGSLAIALANRGWQIHVVASRQVFDDANANLARRECCQRISIHRIWTTRFGREHLIGRAIDYLSFYFSVFLCLLRLAGRRDVIIAATDPPLVSVATWLAARLTGAKQINWLQDLFPEVASALRVIPRRGACQLLGHLRDRSLRFATINVAIGDRMSARVAGLGVPASRLTVIHNWSDGAAIRSLPRHPNRLRVEWNLGDNFVVGYSGNCGRAHDFVTILRAAEALRDETEITFLFVGDGHYRRWIEAETQRRALTNVMLKPFQPAWRLAESLAVPDLHIVSLRPELEGLVVPSKFYGIAAAGRPAIFVGDPAGEIACILREGNCGSAVAPGDVDGLVAHIRAMHRLPLQRETWGANARRMFMRRFDQQIAIARWSDVIARAVGAVTHDTEGAGVKSQRTGGVAGSGATPRAY